MYNYSLHNWLDYSDIAINCVYLGIEAMQWMQLISMNVEQTSTYIHVWLHDLITANGDTIIM